MEKMAELVNYVVWSSRRFPLSAPIRTIPNQPCQHIATLGDLKGLDVAAKCRMKERGGGAVARNVPFTGYGIACKRR